MKKFSILLALLTLISAFCVGNFTVCADSANLINKSTDIVTLDGASAESIGWSWDNGTLSFPNTAVDSYAIFDIKDIDESKTYCFSGQIKVKDFRGADAYLGPRIIYRGHINNGVLEYASLNHFQDTMLYLCDFVGGAFLATRPDAATNVRLAANKNIEFKIYQSKERIVVYYDGQKRFDVKIQQQVKDIPMAFGVWSIGNSLEMSNISLTETNFPDAQATPTTIATPTTENTTASTDDAASATTTAKIDTGTTANGSTQPTSIIGAPVDTTPGDNDNNSSGWIVPTIIIVAVVIVGGIVAFLIIKKKKV